MTSIEYPCEVCEGDIHLDEDFFVLVTCGLDIAHFCSLKCLVSYGQERLAAYSDADAQREEDLQRQERIRVSNSLKPRRAELTKQGYSPMEAHRISWTEWEESRTP
jgi:hypothetical protein